MSRKNSGEIRKEVAQRRGRKKQNTFRNDALRPWVMKLLSDPNFAHLKPGKETNSKHK